MTIQEVCKVHGWPEPGQEGFDRVLELKLRYIFVNRAKMGFEDPVEAWADPHSYQNVLNSFDANKVNKALEDMIGELPYEIRDVAWDQLLILKELIDGYKLLLR